MIRRSTLAAILPLGLLAGCGGTTYESAGTLLARGTDATVHVTDDDAGNHELDVEIEHLPPPGRLAPGTRYFVVWSVPARGLPQHIGSLHYDEGSRVGQLDTISPHEIFEVLVTAEVERLPMSPSENVVVRQPIAHD